MRTVIDEIRSAFPAGQPPSRPITGHRCGECDEVDRLMGGRAWTDVADDFPHHCHDTFSLMTPDAMIYYLPAYMAIDILSPGSMAGISVSSAFERGDFAPSQFDDRQRSAIAQWLKQYYRSEPEGVVPRTLAERWNVSADRPAV